MEDETFTLSRTPKRERKTLAVPNQGKTTMPLFVGTDDLPGQQYLPGVPEIRSHKDDPMLQLVTCPATGRQFSALRTPDGWRFLCQRTGLPSCVNRTIGVAAGAPGVDLWAMAKLADEMFPAE